MARPKKYPNRREIQTDAEIDAMVNDWRTGKPLAYAEAVREMIYVAAHATLSGQRVGQQRQSREGHGSAQAQNGGPK